MLGGMAFSQAQLRGVAAILYDVVTSETVKLRWGRQVRDRLREAERRGEKISGYRVEWVRATKQALVKTLSAQAAAFNTQYPHDRISTLDFLDALEGTARAFRKNLKESG